MPKANQGDENIKNKNVLVKFMCPKKFQKMKRIS